MDFLGSMGVGLGQLRLIMRFMAWKRVGQDVGAIPESKKFNQQLPCTIAHPGFCRKSLTPKMEQAIQGLCILLKAMARGTFFGLRFRFPTDQFAMMLDLDRGIDTYYKVLALNDDDRSVLLAVDTFYVGDQHRTQLTPTGPFGFDFQMVQSAVFQVRLLASLFSSSYQDGHITPYDKITHLQISNTSVMVCSHQIPGKNLLTNLFSQCVVGVGVGVGLPITLELLAALMVDRMNRLPCIYAYLVWQTCWGPPELLELLYFADSASEPRHIEEALEALPSTIPGVKKAVEFFPQPPAEAPGIGSVGGAPSAKAAWISKIMKDLQNTQTAGDGDDDQDAQAMEFLDSAVRSQITRKRVARTKLLHRGKTIRKRRANKRKVEEVAAGIAASDGGEPVVPPEGPEVPEVPPVAAPDVPPVAALERAQPLDRAAPKVVIL
jgi:hypothetical protein